MALLDFLKNDTLKNTLLNEEEERKKAAREATSPLSFEDFTRQGDRKTVASSTITKRGPIQTEAQQSADTAARQATFDKAQYQKYLQGFGDDDFEEQIAAAKIGPTTGKEGENVGLALDMFRQEAMSKALKGEGPGNFLITPEGKTIGVSDYAYSPTGSQPVRDTTLGSSYTRAARAATGVTGGSYGSSYTPPPSSSGPTMSGGSRSSPGYQVTGGVTGSQRYAAEEAKTRMRLATELERTSQQDELARLERLLGFASSEEEKGRQFTSGESEKQRAQDLEVLARQAALAEEGKVKGYERLREFTAPVLQRLLAEQDTPYDAGTENELAQALQQERQQAISELNSELARRGSFRTGERGEGVSTEAVTRLLAKSFPEIAKAKISLRESEKDRKSKEKTTREAALAQLLSSYGGQFL